MQEVILVNEQDEVKGTMEKMAAHEQGLLHRAFSVFIFDRQGRMLLQQRAAGKYHGAHLWTNACCSHPFPGEETAAATLRRLEEELGFTAPVEEIFAFTYRAEVENGLVEHEYDHVFAGEYEGPLNLNTAEVAACTFVPMEALEKDLALSPERYTTWFRIAFPRIEQWWRERYGREGAAQGPVNSNGEPEKTTT
jgi:isopentenyl-diphosphate delta-isomerase